MKRKNWMKIDKNKKCGRTYSMTKKKKKYWW